jgi:two-component system sensor histidine kinase KdpD
VVDHGPGVPAGSAHALFAPFSRLDRHGPGPLGDRAAGGLGLGLSVARGFAEAMGGTLDAVPTPGGGLTVRLTLPAAGA